MSLSLFTSGKNKFLTSEDCLNKDLLLSNFGPNPQNGFDEIIFTGYSRVLPVNTSTPEFIGLPEVRRKETICPT